jgi:glutamate N-acetyltransferase/amino-acid N-acetyltransferase
VSKGAVLERLVNHEVHSAMLPSGYRFAGIHCGIRSDPSRLDLALVVSDRPAAAAGVFTQNRVMAAPVRVCRERLPMADARGIVVCSGNANACTGRRGLEDAERMTALTAEAIGCRANQVLVCSTGVIGQQLPMPALETGIPAAALKLGQSPAAFEQAASAILTTDTHIKVSNRTVNIDGADYRVAGFAKGAAMIGPNLATMLAFVLTDASIAPDDLWQIARQTSHSTFDCVSVEGHTSTNDSLIFLANGAQPVLAGEPLKRWANAAREVCGELARAIAEDAEGASHLVRIDVHGLRDDSEAHRVAKTVAESALVKTAIFGADPNWGRFVSAAGYAGVPFEEESLSLWLGDLLLYQAGTPQPFNAAAASAYLKSNREIHLRLQFNLGTGSCTFWTCDLGYEYVRLNAEYTT